jgi:dipicolinate synthase subunit A
VRAFADGYAVCQCTPEALATALAHIDLTYTTAQEWLLTRAVLGQARPGALVMDLASPPGGMDHDGARALGLNVVWARAQAGSAPRHAGHAQFRVMARILDAEWGDGRSG